MSRTKLPPYFCWNQWPEPQEQYGDLVDQYDQLAYDKVLTETMANSYQKRLEFKQGRSNKYWEIYVCDNTLKIHWGKIGTAGSWQVKGQVSADSARRGALILVGEKLKKGYIEVAFTNNTKVSKNVLDTLSSQPVTKQDKVKPVEPADEPKSIDKQRRSFRL